MLVFGWLGFVLLLLDWLSFDVETYFVTSVFFLHRFRALIVLLCFLYMYVLFFSLFFFVFFVCFSFAGPPANQQAGQGDRLDGARVPTEAEAHHASPRDPLR